MKRFFFDITNRGPIVGTRLSFSDLFWLVIFVALLIWIFV